LNDAGTTGAESGLEENPVGFYRKAISCLEHSFRIYWILVKFLVFTYAPAGLGHLRVMDALVDSRPKECPYVILGSYDEFITNAHRFSSNNPIAKWIFESSQSGLLEDLVTVVYRRMLIWTSAQIYAQLKQIIEKNTKTDEFCVIATHFGMAHQIGAIKTRLVEETGKKIRLIVQVTDDTSQHMWCIKGADLTFVPSLHTKKGLQEYSDKKKMNLAFEVIPYPISPILTKKIEGESRDEVFSSADGKINVAVPISGAAVGLPYITKLISSVRKKSDRFIFWVLAKKSVYTKYFLSTISRFPNVKIITGRNDNEMISSYCLMYQNNLMHIEITKPSEQAFKAILPPTLIGGSIMLFSSPVGRQEYENIEFLTRHDLMPHSNFYGSKEHMNGIENYPRAISLPKNPELAADFILWGLESGLFKKMGASGFEFSKKAVSSGEIGPSGAVEFWKIIKKHFC